MKITDKQKRIVRSTSFILREHGKEITSIFYKHLFQAHPELLNFFNQTNQKMGTQPLALANIIYFAAENIDHLDILMPQITTIAHKHRALAVQPEHYPIIGKYILKAISEFLGDRATTEIMDAWTAAYDTVASIFIETEKKLYEQLGDDEESKGFIPFTIVKKEKIAEGPIYAVELQRADGGSLIDYHSGQYITLRVKKDGLYHNRHYGLVRLFDGKIYRIAMKIESDCDPKGVFTNDFMAHYDEGDTIYGTLPAGSFSVYDKAKHHLFIAGGVGITVLSTMIEDLCLQNKAHIVTVLHCVASPAHAAYKDRLKKILPDRHVHWIFDDRKMLADLIAKHVTPETHVYLCAGVALMKDVEHHLSKCRLPSSQIHINSFRPILSVAKNAVKDQSTTKTI